MTALRRCWLQLSRLRRAGGLFAAGAAAFVLVSCGTGHPPTYPTKGVVKINGQPAEGVDVTFVRPVKEGETNQLFPHGTTGPDGAFQISTYGVNDGAPVGEYAVSLAWPSVRKGSEVGPDKLGGKFGADASGLKVTVEAKKNELAPFDVKAELLSDREIEEVKKLTTKQLRRRERNESR